MFNLHLTQCTSPGNDTDNVLSVFFRLFDFYNPDESGDYRLFEVARDEMMILAIDSLGRDFQQRLIKRRPTSS